MSHRIKRFIYMRNRLYNMDMDLWTRSLVKTEDHDIYRAYAAYSGMKIHGAYREAIKQLLDKDNLRYVDGIIMKK